MRSRIMVVVITLFMMTWISWSVCPSSVRLKLPDMIGSVFAVEIVDFKVAESGSGSDQCYWSTETAAALLGPPPEKLRDGDENYVSLGEDGFVVVRMGSPFTIGDGADLRVYACPNQGYGLYSVSISIDASSWIEVADRVRSDNSATWYRSIDFNRVEGQFEYVRIDADAGNACVPYILAIEARHPCAAAPPTQAPTARFTYSPSILTMGTAATFDASPSTDVDGVILSYQWLFGDGFSGAGQAVTHTFSRAGSFNVRLDVTDTDGLTASTSLEVQVVEPQSPPIAAFSYYAANGSTADAQGTLLPGELVSFDASGSSSSSGRILEYAWDWDSDSQFEELSHQPMAEHAFDAPGTYLVTLRVIDDSGLAEFAMETIEVAEPITLNRVPVSFLSTPDGADVEIDGYFVGTTPLELMLDLGAVYEIRISLAGFSEWTRTLKVFEGLAVNVTLASQ